MIALQLKMTQREKALEANNKGSSPVRGKMPKPFLLLFIFLMPRSGTPSASLLSSTIFADDTLLSMADENLDTLEKRVNSELKLINDWLQNNKLSLNYSKTCYLLFSKHPYISVNSNFSVHINSKIEKNNSVKYLELLIDDKLN